MKCKCGLEMELWQTTKVDGVVIKRYRCMCGLEKSETEEHSRDVKLSNKIKAEE